MKTAHDLLIELYRVGQARKDALSKWFIDKSESNLDALDKADQDESRVLKSCIAYGKEHSNA